MPRPRIRRGSQQDLEQVSGYAFNFFGWAMKDRRPDRDRHVHLRAHKPIGTVAITAIEKCITNGKQFFPTDIDLSSQDDFTDRRSDTTAVYLVVGCTTKSIIEFGAHLGKQRKAPRAGKIIGVEKPTRDTIIYSHTGVGNPDDAVLYVVLPMNTPARTYLVLLEPEDGLCYPYMVDEKAVFFFWQFRTRNISGLRWRFPSWRATALEIINELLAGASAHEIEDETDVDEEVEDDLDAVDDQEDPDYIDEDDEDDENDDDDYVDNTNDTGDADEVEEVTADADTIIIDDVDDDIEELSRLQQESTLPNIHIEFVDNQDWAIWSVDTSLF